MKAENKGLSKDFIHSVIGLAVMILFRFLPNLPYVTDVGMQVLGIFIGTLYLWTFSDTIWSSLMSIALLAFSDYAPVNEVLAGYWGDSTILFVFFMYILAGALVEYGVTDYIAHFFLTRKITNGRPWLFIFIVGIGCIVLGAFSSPFTAILLFWPVLDEVMASLGYEESDKFPQIVRILIVTASLLGFPVAPFMQNGLVLIENFAAISAEVPGGPIVVPSEGYFMWTIIISVVCWLAIILVTKYIIRPDTEKFLGLDIVEIEKTKPAPMNTRQKIIGYGFLITVILLLVPSIFKGSAIMDYLGSLNKGIPLIMTAILCMIILSDGEPALEFPKVAANHINWGSFFIICTAIYIGNALVDPTTGVTEFINWGLEPILGGLSPQLFVVVILIIAGILTNLGNSLVIGILLQPVILAYFIKYPEINVYAINTLFIYFVLASAIIFPSASPFSALMHGNQKIETGLIYKTTPIYVVIEYLVILLLGMPLANMIFG